MTGRREMKGGRPINSSCTEPMCTYKFTRPAFAMWPLAFLLCTIFGIIEQRPPQSGRARVADRSTDLSIEQLHLPFFLSLFLSVVHSVLRCPFAWSVRRDMLVSRSPRTHSRSRSICVRFLNEGRRAAADAADEQRLRWRSEPSLTYHKSPSFIPSDSPSPSLPPSRVLEMCPPLRLFLLLFLASVGPDPKLQSWRLVYMLPSKPTVRASELLPVDMIRVSE